jgi:UrcA family protein
MPSKTMKTLAMTLATLGTTIAPAAFASTFDEVSVEIDARYLETDWGVEKVYKSLSRTAQNACDTGGTRDISARKYERDCRIDLLNDFIKSADHEKLTTYHASVVK